MRSHRGAAWTRAARTGCRRGRPAIETSGGMITSSPGNAMNRSSRDRRRCRRGCPGAGSAAISRPSRGSRVAPAAGRSVMPRTSANSAAAMPCRHDRAFSHGPPRDERRQVQAGDRDHVAGGGDERRRHRSRGRIRAGTRTAKPIVSTRMKVEPRTPPTTEIVTNCRNEIDGSPNTAAASSREAARHSEDERVEDDRRRRRSATGSRFAPG